MNVIGEAPIGESYTVEQAYDDTPALSFIYGVGPVESGQSAFLHGYIFPLPAFYQRLYIEGVVSFQTNLDDNWGTYEEAEAEINEVGSTNINSFYYPIKSYINGAAPPNITKTQNAYIVMKTLVMDVPTKDGMDNPIANMAEDFGDHKNHMRLYRQPTWIDGP